MGVSKKQRAQILSKSDGRCWYCGNELKGKWHVDHVIPVVRILTEQAYRAKIFGDVPTDIKTLLGSNSMRHPEHDTLSNMVPACVPCNLFKTTYSVEQFRSQISRQAERARKNSINFRTAERFGLVEAINKPVVFWFEKQTAPTEAP